MFCSARNVVTLCCVLALVGLACGRRTTDETLLEGYRVGKAHRWPDAEPLIRLYLLDHPNDAGAHYLLGQCFQHRPDPYLVRAQGEFRTARQLLERTGTVGALGRFMSPKRFEAATYRETARVYMRAAHQALSFGVQPDLIIPQLEEALEHVRRGLELHPDSKPLQEMQRSLEDTLVPQRPPAPQPAPEPPPLSIPREYEV